MLQLSITRVGPTLVWAVVGVMIAVGLDLPIRWVENRLGVRRSVIVILGAVVVAASVVALFMGTRWQLDAAPSADEDVPAVVEALEGLPLVGDSLADFDLDRRFAQLERRLPGLINRSPMAGQAVGLLGGGLVGFFWVSVTVLTALLDGPRLVAAIDRRIPARFSRQASRLARAAKTALAGYVAGSALVALINAALVGTIATIVGTPIPLVLALWAFTWNFIPQIGAVIGWAPLLVLALAVGPLAGGLTLAFFIVYQAVENNLLQPTIVGQAVDISPLAALGAALFGAAIGGLIGAVLAIPIVGVSRALVTEYRRDDFPRLSQRTV